MNHPLDQTQTCLDYYGFGGVLSDAGAVAASGLELPQAQLAQLEAWLMHHLGPQVGDQLACMQDQI